MKYRKEANTLKEIFKSEDLAVKHVELLITGITDTVKYIRLTREDHQILDNHRAFWIDVIKELKNDRR